MVFKKTIKYIISISIGLLMAIAVCCSKCILSQSAKEVVRIISDAFILPGVMYCGLGGLAFASNEGTFSMASYGMKRIFSYIRNKKEFREQYNDYYEYYSEQKKHSIPILIVLLPGIVFLLISITFNSLYYYI